MATVYDEVHAEALHDHIAHDWFDADLDDEVGGHMAELDRTDQGDLAVLIDEEYRHDAACGAFDPRPDGWAA